MLEAIRYSRSADTATLSILDQLQLPHKTEYVDIHTCEDAFDAILTMKVRGAPAIAIVAALALSVELLEKRTVARQTDGLTAVNGADKVTEINDRLKYLVSSRPTAVNLGRAARDLAAAVDKTKAGTADDVVDSYCAAAEKMLANDVADNKAIGQYGADWLLKQSKRDKVRVLTHCNTGSLATASYGTALGIIRHLHHSRKALDHAFCTETRPYNQGARLTAYELVEEQIPATLVTDSMAGSLLAGGWGQSDQPGPAIDAIIVGADRVAANGDTANKIGTYSLAVLAQHHPGTKFIVAAPWTTIDLDTKSGRDIEIEQRKPDELTTVAGPPADGTSTAAVRIRLAAPGIGVWNPSFDVTPAGLIDAIVTEKGVVERGPDGSFDLSAVSEAA